MRSPRICKRPPKKRSASSVGIRIDRRFSRNSRTRRSSEFRMKLVESKRIYDGQVINLRVDTLETRSGPHPFEIVEHRGAVVVIAQPTTDSVVLVHQYRRPADAMLWEAPAGG